LGIAGIQVFVHRASFDDIARDNDRTRREQSISKLKKYATVEKSDRNLAKLATEFGPISNQNDEADCQILSAIADGAADILVTEDAELHRRAARFKLQDKVFRVRQLADYLSLLNSAPETTIKFIEKKSCYQLDKTDPIFGSLRSDYNGFDLWWAKSCAQHRQCWIVQDENKNVAGLVVFKDESETSGDGIFPSSRVLKLCTFKVSESNRGGRLGEQLLKQSIWHAASAKYDVAYLTVFKKQSSLIDLLKLYGFIEHSSLDGELVYAKMLKDTFRSEDQYDWHLLNYPKLHDSPIAVAIIPIKPEFHRRLLPEA
jgi:predicted GNAT family N-acyltransferase/predicted nucleic acid-binding protein